MDRTSGLLSQQDDMLCGIHRWHVCHVDRRVDVLPVLEPTRRKISWYFVQRHRADRPIVFHRRVGACSGRR